MLWNLSHGKIFIRHGSVSFSPESVRDFMQKVKHRQASDQWGIPYIDAYATQEGFIYAAPADINDRFQQLLFKFGADQAFILVTRYASLKRDGDIFTFLPGQKISQLMQ